MVERASATLERQLSHTHRKAFENEKEQPSFEYSPGFQRKNSLKIRIVSICVFFVALASLLSYFVKPKQSMLELVTPDQELPTFAAQYPGDRTLVDRVLSSYGLAMVLVQSPYTETNVAALEDLRNWAKQKFQLAPDFLHPISIHSPKEPNDTVFGALGYNLFAGLRYFLEAQTGEFLRFRIADFHQSSAYNSFQHAYFDLYGKDAESATLLAKYQSEKAKIAVPVLLWSVAWAAIILASLFSIIFAAGSRKFERIRIALASLWVFAGVTYASSAWMNNSIAATLSAALSLAAGCYFAKPFIFMTREDASLKITFIQLSSKWIAFSVWLTFSLMAILVLTWIRGSVPNNPDPVTLLLSSLSGNFLHDPENGKRFIMRALGMLWIVVSCWAFLQRNKDARMQDELEDGLNSL